MRVISGSLPVLDLEVQYAALDPHALDGAAPDASMHHSESAGTTPNSEELRKGAVECRFNPFLPPSTPDAAKNSPVLMHFQVSANSTLLDACGLLVGRRGSSGSPTIQEGAQKLSVESSMSDLA